MTQHNDSKQLKKSFIPSLTLTIALGAFVGLGGPAAHAGLTIFDAANGSTALLPGTLTTTADYSLGDSFGDIPSPYTVALGGNQVTFTAQAQPSNANAFEGFRNQISTLTGKAFDFPYGTSTDSNGTHLIDTFDPFTQSPTGPLQIDFSTPVGSFGFKSQSSRSDQEQFTFSIYDSANNLLGSSTTQTFDNMTGQFGKSVFIGAESTTADISRVVISSFSTASDPNTGIFNYHGGSNDFYTGPVSTGAPVPEASTEVGLGLGMLFLGGLTLVSRKRKAKPAL